MSRGLTIDSYKGAYNVDFSDNITGFLDHLDGTNSLFIVDQAVVPIYPRIKEVLEDKNCILIAATEKAKSYDQLSPIIEKMIHLSMSKDATIVAIGGGIIQDIAAFTSSIFKRGIDWVFIPTTLLAQCDSCIGSKTSINFGDYKNQLGGFHPPKRILINTGLLQSLPEREVRAGIGEMFHYFLVSDAKISEWAGDNTSAAIRRDPVLDELIYRSLSIKKKMIELDEFDQGPRQVFNYGHTFGHALEASTDYNVPHGIAVAIGMELANRISVLLGYLTEEERLEIHQYLKPLWVGFEELDVDLKSYWLAIKNDKKNVGTQVNVILTRGIGDMFKTPLPLDKNIVYFIEDFYVQKRWLDE